MQLPDRWIDRIFARLLVRYGAAWFRMWEGVDEAAIKADWANELGGYAANHRAIEHALEHLPADKPPTVAQFAQLCRGAPVVSRKQLPAPKSSPERRADVLASVHKAFDGGQRNERQCTLRRIAERRAAGLPLSQYQRDVERELMAREEAFQ